MIRSKRRDFPTPRFDFFRRKLYPIYIIIYPVVLEDTSQLEAIRQRTEEAELSL